MTHPAPVDPIHPDVALVAWARARGAQVAWGGTEALAAAAEELGRRRRSREIDPRFDEAHLSGVTNDAPPAWARRVVMVALPRPAHRLEIQGPGGRRSVLLPPTYLRYHGQFGELLRELETVLAGARVEVCAGPLKATAARLGLVEYGRNNLTYAPEAGSYIQLLGYLTDSPLPLPEGWTPQAPRLLAACEDCHACLEACPTAAIRPDRVLLHAEQCLTALNELPGAWPAGVPERAHHTIVGCLRCQVRCPRNPKLPVAPAGVSLDADETAALLAGEVPTSVREKLRTLGQESLAPALPRNVAALFRSAQPGPRPPQPVARP